MDATRQRDDDDEETWSSGPGEMLELLLTTAHRVAVQMHSDLLGEMSTLQLVGLRFLLRAPSPMTARDLALALGCTPTTITQLVHRLVRDGHVVQKEDERDRRCKRLHVTEDGAERAAAADDALNRCVGTFARELDTRERIKLLQLLRRLEKAGIEQRSTRRAEMVEWPTTPPRRRARPSIHVR